MGFLRRRRLAAVLGSFIVILALLIVNLWFVQIKDGEKYAIMALEQGSTYVSLEEVCRGQILDRNLLSLNGGREAERIVVFPELLEKEEVSRGLAEILDLPQAVLINWLQGAPCYLPYQLSAGQTEAINKRGWKGVTVLPVNFRYGDSPLAVQVTGHLGSIFSREELSALSAQSNKIYHYDDLVGKIGLEKMYDSALKGTRPLRAVRVYRDANGSFINGMELAPAEEGRDSGRCDLVLTIDARVQQIVEDVLDSRATKGAVVVMEAGTGDLLALASRPAFHPARVEDYLQTGDDEQFFDHCTALYQPGSVFKIVLAAAALEEGLVSNDSLLDCDGVKDDLIHCWHEAGHGRITFPHAFAESCNPAFAQVGLNLGAQKIIEYAEKLGLDNQSVIGYPLTPDLRQNLSLIGAPNNLVNSSVGQGPVLATPVQISSMLNAIISGGVYRAPRLVKEVRNNGGDAAEEFAVDTDTVRRVIRTDTAAALCKLMEMATDQRVAKDSILPGFESAGKTGSAQTGDSKHSVNAWFTGYAPRANPRYIITVLVEDGISGSESAAPIFQDIMEKLARLDLD